MDKPTKPKISESLAIRFDKDDRRRIKALQKAHAGVSMASVVKMAVKQAYDRLMDSQKMRRLATSPSSQEQP